MRKTKDLAGTRAKVITLVPKPAAWGRPKVGFATMESGRGTHLDPRSGIVEKLSGFNFLPLRHIFSAGVFRSL